MDGQDSATLRDIEHNTSRSEGLLEKIVSLLEEIRDNTKPATTMIGPFTATSKNHFDALENCNCRRNESGHKIGGWYCPVHRPQL